MNFSGVWSRALIRREVLPIGQYPQFFPPPTHNVFSEINEASDPAARSLFMFLSFFANIPGITWLEKVGAPAQETLRMVEKVGGAEPKENKFGKQSQSDMHW